MSQTLTRQQQAAVSLALWIADRVARTAARTARHLSLDDLQQTARMALTEAALRYDASHGVPFEKFAWKRIVGAVLRALGRESKRQRRATAAFLTMLDAPVESGDSFVETDAEVSDRIDDRCADAASAIFLELVADAGGAEEALAREETLSRARRLTEEALGSLADVPRRVIQLRYWDERDWPEVAATVGLSKTTVQYHEGKAREHIRRHLLAHGVREVPS